jgi:ribosomal protein L13E
MVLGTLIHESAYDIESMLAATMEELAPLPEDVAARYAGNMLGQLSERPRTILEALMQTETYPYQSKLLAERESRGEVRGAIKKAEEAVLTVIDARGLFISENQRRRIEQCDDLARLNVWLRRAVNAPTVDDSTVSVRLRSTSRYTTVSRRAPERRNKIAYWAVSLARNVNRFNGSGTRLPARSRSRRARRVCGAVS